MQVKCLLIIQVIVNKRLLQEMMVGVIFQLNLCLFWFGFLKQRKLIDKLGEKKGKMRYNKIYESFIVFRG